MSSHGSNTTVHDSESVNKKIQNHFQTGLVSCQLQKYCVLFFYFPIYILIVHYGIESIIKEI